MSSELRDLEEMVDMLRKALDRLLESTFRRTASANVQEDYGRLGAGAVEDAEAALRLADSKLGSLWRVPK